MTGTRWQRVPGSAANHWAVDEATGQVVQTVVPPGCVRADCGRHTCVTVPGRIGLPCGHAGWCTQPLRELSDKRHDALLQQLRRPRPPDIVIRFRGGPL